MLLMSFPLTACLAEEDPFEPISMREYIPPTAEPFFLPDSDIVFLYDSQIDIDDKKLVFITENGTENIRFQHGMSIAYDQAPSWTDDGAYVFLSSPSNWMFVYTKSGEMMRLRGLDAGYIAPIHDSNEILAESYISVDNVAIYAIKRIDINTGEIMDIYPLSEKYNGMELGTDGFHNHNLLYARWARSKNQDHFQSEIVIYDTISGKEDVVISGEYYTMRYPAYSPDGTWIAYTNTSTKLGEYEDSIYLVRPDGSEHHKIIENTLSYWKPMVSWSPDGKWLVYHRCTASTDDDCYYHYENNAVFKYNIETGEEVMLAPSGIYPYWRWKEIE